MYYLSCGVLLFLFVLMITLLFKLASPLSLAFLFFMIVVLMTLSGCFFYSDYFPYMLYLIYIGGLLVLMVYMVIMSTNFQLRSPMYSQMALLVTISVFIMLLLYYNSCFIMLMDKSMHSTGNMEMDSGALIMLVLFLLYAFMYICESLRVGGRALNICV